MPALACIKILVGEAPSDMDSDALAALVSKVAGAYLELEWTWPRRYGEIAPFAFALADPRATRHDATELQRLSSEIHLMLFGPEGQGEVALLMLEGEESEVMRFAGASNATLIALLEGRDEGEFKGRICKITPTGATSLKPPGGPVDGWPPGEEMAAYGGGDQGDWLGPAPARSRWSGVYLPARERFVGSLAERAASNEVGAPTPTEAELMVQDMACLKMAGEVMKEAATGIVFVPLNYTGLIKPSLRQAYTAAIGALQPDWRSRIAASVYQTPRAPPPTALRQVQMLLQPFFSVVNLQVTDPAFDIEGLHIGMVNSVSLMLGKQGERERVAAITRFTSASHAYKLKRVPQGVFGVRTARELDLCRRLKVTFVSGPGVSTAAPRPWGDIGWPADQLPYR